MTIFATTALAAGALLIAAIAFFALGPTYRDRRRELFTTPRTIAAIAALAVLGVLAQAETRWGWALIAVAGWVALEGLYALWTKDPDQD